MSLYYYGLPNATHQFSGNTIGHKSMAGVMSPTKCCSECGIHKPQRCSTKRNGKFVCADCKSSPKPNWFSAMVTGTIAIPAIPRRGVKPHKLGDDIQGQAGIRAKNEKAVLDAINSGYYAAGEICRIADISPTTLKNITEPLIKRGVLEKGRKGREVHYRETNR